MEQLQAWSFTKLLTKMERMPIYWYIPLAYLVLCALLLPVGLLSDWLHISDKIVNSQNMPTNVWLKYLFAVLAGPFLETFIFQALPFYFLSLFQFIRRNVWIIILVSSIGFGLAHNFSTQSIIHGTLVGFIFISTYIIRTKNKDPFLCTYLLHAFYNFMAITLSYIL
jgi:hypothetical protein